MAMEKRKPGEAGINNDKKQALETAIKQIEKNFGKGSVMRLGDRPEMTVEAIPTGSLALDAALGIGGVPKGRIIEIYGPESSGKTTLALHIVAQAQKRGGEVAFVDAEHALDPDYAARIGVDIDSMLVSQPDTGEQALEITDALVRSGALDAYFLYCPSEALCVGLRRQTVFYTRLCALVPLDHPLSARKTLSLAELEGEMLLLYPPTREPALHQRILEALHAAGVRAALYAGKSSPALYQMQVKMGCGIAICPQLALKTPPQTVAIPLSDPLCRIQIEMLSAEENPNPAFRLFLEEFGDRSGADIG